MYYVYILLSLKDRKMYMGRSDDLKRRIAEHNAGKVKATKNRRPLELIFYEAFKSRQDAIRRERYFKTGKGKSSIKQTLRESIK